MIDAYETYIPVVVRDPVEWLSVAIVGQQISRTAAVAIFGRLQAALGGAVDQDTVSAADDAALREAGLSQNTMTAIRALAEHVHDGMARQDAV